MKGVSRTAAAILCWRRPVLRGGSAAAVDGGAAPFEDMTVLTDYLGFNGKRRGSGWDGERRGFSGW
ncbi:hypothetical protein GCM10010390_51060 [Streptomyces mordarskii]|uniref:Uncharacterized protein n=1 Tax=Streptomyces mordarskii TaxID=1226758 RepID=A0ABN1DG84_9ACTN